MYSAREAHNLTGRAQLPTPQHSLLGKTPLIEYNIPMNNRPIGIVDSGVGGLSIWEKIAANLPVESTIYLADSKNIPYGNKSQEQIYELAHRMLKFLLKKDVKIIILACNTVTVSCLDKLRQDFPQVPIIGTVPVVKTAVEKTRNKIIGILSTESTAKSEYQKNLISSFADGCEVINLGTNQLVPFVEKGEVWGEKISEVLVRELKEFKARGVDVIALGCTHFPFLKKAIGEIMGDKVVILDSGDAIARQTKRVLEKTNNLASRQKPFYSFYTTGDPTEFSQASLKLLNNDSMRAEGVSLE